MAHGSERSGRREQDRQAALAAAFLLLSAAAAYGQGGTPGAPSCATSIAAALADIAARDLDTSRGPPLNAFLALNPSAAAQAQALDRRTAAGEARGPLHCVPVAVKDNFDTYDMPATAGSLALIGNQPPRDAPFVARLRKAGAIVIGKTNMDEFAMGIRGLSGAGGRVGNAYDTAQSAGGSSAGSGAAVGAGLVPLAVGSDNCGSLRIPAAYNGAVALRATYGRFDAQGIFPIGFVNGVPGVIARDTVMLRAALAVVSDDWQMARTGGLRGKRIGMLRRFDGRDPWAAGDAGTQAVFAQAVEVLRRAGAEVVEDVVLEPFDAKLGGEFLKGFGRKVDEIFATYPAARRNWRDVCTSGRIRPEWSAQECLSVAATAPRQEKRAADQIAGNQRAAAAVLDRQALDAVLYPVDGRGGARADASDHITCFIASASGLPAAAFPAGVDARGMPVGVELMGRAGADEALVAMMTAFEQTRGPLPRARPIPVNDALAALDIARQNALRLRLGWSAFHSRRGKELGALEPERFRALTEELVKSAVENR